MASSRNALGRGIGALIPGASTGNPVLQPAGRTAPVPASPPAAASESLHELPLDAIDPNPEQPRRRFDAGELEKLADSIREHGVLQPVVVRRAGERYELIVGERRWRASRAAGRATIPALVADKAAPERLAIALVENVQRDDLNPIELAHAFRALASSGATQDEIGRQVSLDRSTIANHLRLLELSRALQEDVEGGVLSTGHAKALLQIANPEQRQRMRDRVVRDGLSVRALEEQVRRSGGPRATRKPRPTADPNLSRVVDALRQRLQTRVRVQGDGKRGRIEVEYFGADDLARISDILLGDG